MYTYIPIVQSLIDVNDRALKCDRGNKLLQSFSNNNCRKSQKKENLYISKILNKQFKVKYL